MSQSIRKVVSLLFLAICFGHANLYAKEVENKIKESDDEARQWMQRSDDQARRTSDSTFTKSTLMTCRYGKRRSDNPAIGEAKRKIGCVEKPRVKVLESVEKRYGVEKKESKAISIVLQPASEKGIGMLTYQYDDVDRDTESWLYLSALGRVKRMVTGSDEEQEPVSFFGSEFTTEDMESGKVDEYHYKILQRTEYRGRPVVVIEAKPKERKRKKSRYSGMKVWLDRERLVMVKSQIYDKRGALLKRIKVGRIEQINGLWMARQVTVINVQSQRLSRFTIKEISMGVEVPDEFLTQRTLTDLAFREGVLTKLRAQSR